MSAADPEMRSRPALAVGDRRRSSVGWAVTATLLSAIVFLLFAWTSKEVRALSDHAPWQNDPYDAVTSFSLFFVPLGAGLLIMRTLLCRRDAPMPVSRLVGMVRATRVVLAAVLVTLVADWLSVVLGADKTTWTTTTDALIAALAVSTLVAAPAAILARRPRVPWLGWETPPGPDAMADGLTLGRQWAARLGMLEGPAEAVLHGLEVHAAPVVRRYPLTAAALSSVAFGAAASVAAVREEGVTAVLGLVFGVASCGMFAFVAAAGSYVGLVRAEQQLVGARRRLADAAILAAAAVPVSLAFRSSLWWVVGAADTTAGLGEFLRLVIVAGGVTFAFVVAAETLTGVHARVER